jgi:hypothetical protein
MALIRDANAQWSAPVTLDTDEVWQARSGIVFLTTSSDPDPEDGLSLVLRDGLRLGSGLTVRYRTETDTAALIVREAVA